MENLPVIAVTMGDAAGVGPEITVKSLVQPEIAEICRPIVIGDLGRLKMAAQIVDVDVNFHEVDKVEEATFEAGSIDVISVTELPDSIEWGELSADAGHAAYLYIEKAAQLSMDGEVQAICTAPINKEALHMGGHNFPGHTELLASLTNTPEVSMMLTAPQLRVIHVTTHIGLIDAIAKIDAPLVQRTIQRGHEALVRAGIENPKIGVCAINPHAGEGGLFGHGEEEEKITPAVEVCKGEGINVEGPLPADSAFYLAGRGDYDLIVAMYHDQGHGPIKVLGIESGVNTTVGLPVIRTSVDHGTAFDIAGTGKAGIESMLEALRQATQYASVK